MAQTQKPTRLRQLKSGTDTAGRHTDRHHSPYPHARRLPPYGRCLNPAKTRTLFVCCGAEAWTRAKGVTWFPESKVVLPYPDRPSDFSWEFARDFSECVIVIDGTPPANEVIISLAAELLAHVDCVMQVSPQGTIIRFNPANRGA